MKNDGFNTQSGEFFYISIVLFIPLFTRNEQIKKHWKVLSMNRNVCLHICFSLIRPRNGFFGGPKSKLWETLGENMIPGWHSSAELAFAARWTRNVFDAPSVRATSVETMNQKEWRRCKMQMQMQTLTSMTSEESDGSRCLAGMHRKSRLNPCGWLLLVSKIVNSKLRWLVNSRTSAPFVWSPPINTLTAHK